MKVFVAALVAGAIFLSCGLAEAQTLAVEMRGTSASRVQ